MKTQRAVMTLMILGAMVVFVAVRAARSSIASTSATPEQIQSALQGSWLITVTPTQGPLAPSPYRELITVTPNGGVVETDTALAVRGFTATPGHGAAAQKELDYSMTFVKLVADSASKYAGLIKYREAGKIDPSLDSYKGTGRADLLSTSGTVLLSYTATVEATRVKVEQFP